jgi:hypothetical protein
MPAADVALCDAPARAFSAEALPALIWVVPLIYPLAPPALTSSATLAQHGSLAGAVFFALSLTWAMAGPVAAVLLLNHLDDNGLDRREHRLAIAGAHLAAVTPPLHTGLLGWLDLVNAAAFRIDAWYVLTVLFAVASVVIIPSNKSSTAVTKRIHAYSALLVGTFALAHVGNHATAIVSLGAHDAVLRALRPIYRTRVIEVLLIAAILVQGVSGVSMVWRTRLRRATNIRNLQAMSGLYLIVFFGSHLLATLRARQHLDTTFSWATGGDAGLFWGRPASLGNLPYYTLAVVALLVHLGCQARWNLARIMPAADARRVSNALMATGVAVGLIVALAACGVHLMG